MALNIPKKEMSEEDIKLNFITPALQKRGWQDNITMETKVKWTDGKINISGNKVVKEVSKRADYTLYESKYISDIFYIDDLVLLSGMRAFLLYTIGGYYYE